MKYLLVVDESGAPMYYDHPDGQMLCPILATSKVHMKTNFDDVSRSLSCGSTRFVQHQYETLLFLLVSDEGEPESVMRSQLHLVYQLFLLLFGPTNLHQRRRLLDRFKKTVQKMVDTAFHLLESNQSVLVQSIELLEVNKDILNRCMGNLKNVVANSAGATHALLFVGTKLLAWYFRPKSFQLSSMDMFLLILFFRGAFHPTLRELEFTKQPIADYTDHEEVIRESMRTGGGGGTALMAESDLGTSMITDDIGTGIVGDTMEEEGGSLDDGFDTATEGDWEDSFTNEPITIDVANPVMLFQGGWLDELFDSSATLPLDTASNSSSDSIPINLTQGLRMDAAQGVLESLRSGLKEGQSNDAIVVLQHALHAINLIPMQTVDGGSFGLTTKQGVLTFQRLHSLPPTGDADLNTLMLLFKRSRIAASVDAEHALSAERLEQLERASTAEKPEKLESPLAKFDKSEKPRLPQASRSARHSLYGVLQPSSAGGMRRVGSSSALDDYSATPKKPGSVLLDSPIAPRRSNSVIFDEPIGFPQSDSPSVSPSPPSVSPSPPPHLPKSALGASASHETSVFEQLYLRSPTHTPMWVYCAELQEITTLVVINKGINGKPEERERLDKSRDLIRNWLRRNYASYLLAKERTHFPILAHLHHLPGLVHYIFVDRTTNRVRAPTISPLHGQVHRDPAATERMLARLRRETWQLVHTAQEHLAQGFTSMLVRRSDFLYSYRLWVEDDEGVEQVIEQSIPANSHLHGTPLGHRFYKELLRWLFPSQSQQMKCYELYTLYIGILPAAMVSKNDRALIALLLERDVD